MNMPGFNAEATFYGRTRQYQTRSGMNQVGGLRASISPAGCTCTDPNCTCTCQPPPPPDCSHCGGLPLCAKSRCLCECAGGIPVRVPPSQHFPCGFACT